MADTSAATPAAASAVGSAESGKLAVTLYLPCEFEVVGEVQAERTRVDFSPRPVKRVKVLPVCTIATRRDGKELLYRVVVDQQTGTVHLRPMA